MEVRILPSAQNIHMNFYAGTVTVKYSGDTASDFNFKQEELSLSAKLLYEQNGKWKELCFDFSYPNIINRDNVIFDLHNWNSQFDDLMLYHVKIEKVANAYSLTCGVVLTADDSVEHFEITGLFNE